MPWIEGLSGIYSRNFPGGQAPPFLGAKVWAFLGGGVYQNTLITKQELLGILEG